MNFGDSTGVAGLSIEDYTNDRNAPLYDFDLAVARVAGPAAGTVTVRPGDTAAKLVAPQKADGVSLDQLLIALLRAGRYRSPQVVLAHFQGSDEGRVLAELAARELLIPRATREAELTGLVEHLVEKQRKRSPQEEYDALLALERSGQKLDKEQRQRLAGLVMELTQGR